MCLVGDCMLSYAFWVACIGFDGILAGWWFGFG